MFKKKPSVTPPPPPGAERNNRGFFRRLFSLNFWKKGSGVTGALVGAGLLGVLAVGVAKITKEQFKDVKKTEINIEIANLSGAIIKLLLNKDACSSSLGVGSSLQNGQSLSAIKNHKGQVVFNKSSTYGNKLIKIDEMSLQDISLSGTAGVSRYGTLNIKIGFERISKLSGGAKKVYKNFPLQIQVDSQDKLIKCYSSDDSVIEDILEKSCISRDGTYDRETKKCDFDTFFTGNCPKDHILRGVKNDGSLDCFVVQEKQLCTPSWVPHPGTITTGKSFTQHDGCGNTRVKTGTSCAPHWTPRSGHETDRDKF